ncbi:DNA/RNA polymerases superfamily protein [Gossypium australe]|uniref:DNA/RNA polymerases superfamily protein n=1 Tax=Gossypium australe TaxID=47621 RepID=A0A5B6VLU1_9ROSI|nr:DNA/RNA polymerases superfamily protein [Gossypium australe]
MEMVESLWILFRDFHLSPSKKDSIWVIVDRFTKTAHFLLVNTTYSLEILVELYIADIVRLHRIPSSIVSYWDLRFTSVEKGYLSARGYVNELCNSLWINWEKYIPQVEFTYNNSYYASLKMSPFEALYGRRCRMLTCWIELSKRNVMGLDLIHDTEEKAVTIQNHLKTAQDRQKAYTDLKRKETSFEIEDKVFLHEKIIIRFGQKGKLSPRFVRPYEVLDKVSLVVYRLALPRKLSKIHNVFHVSMLQRYRSNPSHVVQIKELDVEANLPYDEEPV